MKLDARIPGGPLAEKSDHGGVGRLPRGIPIGGRFGIAVDQVKRRVIDPQSEVPDDFPAEWVGSDVVALGETFRLLLTENRGDRFLDR